MAKDRSRFVCQACGAATPRWAGRCDACGEWNTIVEEAAPPPASLPRRPGSASAVELVGLKGTTAEAPRSIIGIGELDRVLGGGLVVGSAVLLGGDPGIGKSTLLLQAAASLARSGTRTLYLSGEEAVAQIRLRAARLDLAEAPVGLAAVSALRDIAALLDREGPGTLAVIDSIQTLWSDALDSAPGSVAQVRAGGHELVRLAKSKGFALILVGHVTKEGALAGPRVLEHMVDTVLYFEGERGHPFRILRAVKNRFGATDEIGVFEMTETGLAEVANPSALFLAERRGNVAGSAVFAGVEGTRPLLVEVQALLSKTEGGTPRRSVVGWDGSRLSMLLAVLESRCGLTLGPVDVYLNVAGGLRVAEPACDLAVAAALTSAATNTPAPADTVFFGEIGLSGEVRMVGQVEARLKEAAKLGFARACLPRRGSRGRPVAAPAGMELVEIGHLADLVARFEAPGRKKGSGE